MSATSADTAMAVVPVRVSAAGAAGVALGVAVWADVSSHAHWTHTLAVVVLGAIIGITRIVSAGRARPLHAAVTAAFLAQPVTHAAASAVPDHVTAHTLTALAPTMLALAAIAATLACEPLLLHIALAVHRTAVRTLRCTPAPAEIPGVLRGPVAHRATWVTGPYLIADAPRRGPPRLRAVI